MRRWSCYSLLAEAHYVCPSCRHDILNNQRPFTSRGTRSSRVRSGQVPLGLRHASSKPSKHENAQEKDDIRHKHKDEAIDRKQSSSDAAIHAKPSRPPKEGQSNSLPQSIYDFFKKRDVSNPLAHAPNAGGDEAAGHAQPSLPHNASAIDGKETSKTQSRSSKTARDQGTKRRRRNRKKAARRHQAQDSATGPGGKPHDTVPSKAKKARKGSNTSVRKIEQGTKELVRVIDVEDGRGKSRKERKVLGRKRREDPTDKQSKPMKKRDIPNDDPDGAAFIAMQNADLEKAAARATQSENTQTIQKFFTGKKWLKRELGQINPQQLEFTALPVEQPPVPRLAHGLDRVLFNPGVYRLQDQASRVYNFDPYLEKIMPVDEFDFNALKVYKTSSEDQSLSSLARQYGQRYAGSTSSMTASLAHFHFLLSNWRPLNLSTISRGFPAGDSRNATNFTELTRAASAMFLRWKKDGTYAIDADKEFDGANVLMLLGKSMEKVMTMPVAEFERYRKSDTRGVSEAERSAPESYHYSTQGNFLMRSQLDAYDPRLPGTGMFDLKTRAVVAVRMRSSDYEDMTGYEIMSQYGIFESYDREYHDMLRSTLLKYSLQARMGRMDGIFMAFHNVERIFGFQYMNMSEIDRALHGQEDRTLGDQEFYASLDIFQKALDKATERFPEKSIRFHFDARSGVIPFMYIYAEPMEESEIDKIQNSQKAFIAEYERSVMGLDTDDVEERKARANQVIPTALEKTGLTDDEEEAIVPLTEAVDSETEPEMPSSATSPELTSSSRVEDNLRPLLAMTLTLHHRVNNRPVDRPTNLTASDKWAIEYNLAEIEDPTKAWSFYTATKERRRKLFDGLNSRDKEAVANKNEEGETGDKPVTKKKELPDFFIQQLRRLSTKGRERREELDRLDEGKEKVLVGLPIPDGQGSQDNNNNTTKQENLDAAGAGHVVSAASAASTTSATNHRTTTAATEHSISGVDDYVKWLYAR